MGFGLLRVINEDRVQPGQGFATHGHTDMEIISVPIEGSLRHKDSMGNEHVIRRGEVQVMSAGTGVRHSEYNNSNGELVHFLQIWIKPAKLGVAPGYGQKLFDLAASPNQLIEVVSPEGAGPGLPINQQARMFLGQLTANQSLTLPLASPQHGLYLMPIRGSINVAGELLNPMDGLGVSDVDSVNFTSNSPAEVLLIEVPMS